jgi:hypothetical protein
MQLRLSLAAAAIITSMAVQAEDYVSVQYLQYDENENRTSVSAPSIMLNKDFGTDYTLNVSLVLDAVSGATQGYYVDSGSGASAFSREDGVNSSDVEYGNIDYEETRVAGAALLTTRFDNRDELTVGISRSNESDFYSTEASADYMHWLDDSKNKSLSFGLSYQSNEILRRCDGVDGCSGASEAMDSTAINSQISYFQNIDNSSYAKVSLFYSNDDGYLTNPYLNVVRNNNGVTADVTAENRPDSKTAYGIALKYANALTDNLSLHLGYRYYSDDWGIDSHTLDTDVYYELGSDWLFKLGLRTYVQGEADFYNGADDYFTNEVYASSDQRLSDFNALTYKANVEYKISKDLDVNFGAHLYDQSTGLTATYFVTGFTYKF